MVDYRIRRDGLRRFKFAKKVGEIPDPAKVESPPN